jgi:hypothetical protein
MVIHVTFKPSLTQAMLYLRHSGHVQEESSFSRIKILPLRSDDHLLYRPHVTYRLGIVRFDALLARHQKWPELAEVSEDLDQIRSRFFELSEFADQ